MRILMPLLLVACVASPEVPESATPAQSLEGQKSVASCTSSLPQETRIAVQAEAVETKGTPAIRFRLTNVSDQPIRLYPFQLPWGNPNSVNVAGQTLDGRALRTFWPIADPGPETPVIIGPKELLVGDFILCQRIEGLEKARLRSDVIVKWCYPFSALGENTAHRLTGFVVVQKRAP